MMCHSVEMYLPRMTRNAVEHRLGEVDFAAAGRERAVVDVGLGLWARAVRLIRRSDLATTVERLTHG